MTLRLLVKSLHQSHNRKFIQNALNVNNRTLNITRCVNHHTFNGAYAANQKLPRRRKFIIKPKLSSPAFYLIIKQAQASNQNQLKPIVYSIICWFKNIHDPAKTIVFQLNSKTLKIFLYSKS